MVSVGRRRVRGLLVCLGLLLAGCLVPPPDRPSGHLGLFIVGRQCELVNPLPPGASCSFDATGMTLSNLTLDRKSGSHNAGGIVAQGLTFGLTLDNVTLTGFPAGILLAAPTCSCAIVLKSIKMEWGPSPDDGPSLVDQRATGIYVVTDEKSHVSISHARISGFQHGVVVVPPAVVSSGATGPVAARGPRVDASHVIVACESVGFRLEAVQASLLRDVNVTGCSGSQVPSWWPPGTAVSLGNGGNLSLEAVSLYKNRVGVRSDGAASPASTLRIADSSITSNGLGVDAAASALAVTRTRFVDNGGSAAGGEPHFGAVEAHVGGSIADSSFLGGGGFAVNAPDAPVSATPDWWNSASGPRVDVAGLVLGTSGEVVSSGVDFVPFLTSPP